MTIGHTESNTPHLNSVESVVGIGLMNIQNRSEAYDTIAKMLGISRQTAKKLCYMYSYRASNSTLTKAMVEESQVEHTITSVLKTATNEIVYRLENARVQRVNGHFTVRNGKYSFTGNSADFYVVVEKVLK